ncbi:MAG: phytanoyl-CoA dioxygenase family protein [Pseudomonadota bacterium]
MTTRWIRESLSPEDVEALRRIVPAGEKPGIRISIDPPTPVVRAALAPVIHLVKSYYVDAFPVRVVAFSKSTQASWSVPWHQDRVVALREKQTADGFSAWQQKTGIWHAEAPIDILRTLLFVRVLLDEVPEHAGGLIFAKGSHALGDVSADNAENEANKFDEQYESGAAGDVVVMPALTLHRSRRSPQLRRALRIDFARERLPFGLQYASAYASNDCC